MFRAHEVRILRALGYQITRFEFIQWAQIQRRYLLSQNQVLQIHWEQYEYLHSWRLTIPILLCSRSSDPQPLKSSYLHPFLPFLWTRSLNVCTNVPDQHELEYVWVESHLPAWSPGVTIGGPKKSDNGSSLMASSSPLKWVLMNRTTRHSHENRRGSCRCP